MLYLDSNSRTTARRGSRRHGLIVGLKSAGKLRERLEDATTPLWDAVRDPLDVLADDRLAADEA